MSVSLTRRIRHGVIDVATRCEDGWISKPSSRRPMDGITCQEHVLLAARRAALASSERAFMTRGSLIEAIDSIWVIVRYRRVAGGSTP